MADKKDQELQNLPEVRQNASDYFTYEKTPIIQKSVNRGDSREVNPTQYEITDEDIQKLAKNALLFIDKRMLDTAKDQAVSSAVSMAIGNMQEGRWQGKVNADTMDLICGLASKMLTPKEEKKIEKKKDQNDEVQAMSHSTGKKAAEEVEAGKVQKVTPSGALKTVTPARALKDTELEGAPLSRARKLVKGPGSVVILSAITAKMDDLADKLQKAGKEKMATEVDTVANTLEMAIKLASSQKYSK
jgi:hypothetical protein